jgi:hypothetical protein
VDHSPQTPADDRALRLLEHAAIPEPRKAHALAAVKAAQHAARDAGAELQAEFGKDHVGLIVGCNQFTRVWRAGPDAGAIELFLNPADKDALATSGFLLQAPEGAVFKLFGWVRVDPSQGPQAALDDAVKAAFRKAASTKAKK